jgi:hypothetical protein
MFRPADPSVARPPGDGPIDAGAGARTAAADRTALRAAHWPRLCHDLRTPLNAILGNAELLLDGSAGPLSREARACVVDIQAAGDRILRQVQALLELGRACAAPAAVASEALDLLGLVRARAAALDPPVAVQLAPAEARLVVRADPAWLGSLVAALLDVQRGAAPRPAPLRITLERARATDAGAVLCLTWRDFRPDQLPALPVALIEAILDLHEAVVALSADGLRVYWPAARLVQLEPCALLRAHPRRGA